MRHLYQEAAKLVKYGGLTRTRRCKTITLNPAKQLGLDSRARHASRSARTRTSPSSTATRSTAFSRCEMTLVEGEVYFQRADEADAVRRPRRPSPRSRPRSSRRSPNCREGRRTCSAAARSTRRARPAFAGTVVVVAQRARSRRSSPAAGRSDAPAAHVVDATGLHLYPGMIDAGTVLGLVEIDSATRDATTSRDGGDFQPDLRAERRHQPRLGTDPRDAGQRRDYRC